MIASSQRALVGVLTSIAGEAHVLIEGLEDYSRDCSVLYSPPLAVVRPADTQEAAAAVRACAEARVPIVARGAGTGFAGGSVPVEDAVVMSLERLKRLDIHPGDLCAIVGAGVITGDLQDAAGEHGLMYPPDPGSVRISTIGGNIATNAGGMRCVKYGVTAEHVLGLTVVLADGTTVELGGRVRKRASGYRLAQLFVGSEGTLGLVTEAVMKLVPAPAQQALAIVGFPTLDSAAAGVSRLFRGGQLPSALELLDPIFLELMAPSLPSGFGPGLGAALIVEHDGTNSEQVESDLFRSVEILDGVEDRVTQSAHDRDRLWDARRHLRDALEATGTHYLAEDISVPISMIPSMVNRLQAIASDAGVRIAYAGHAGDGNIHPLILFDESQQDSVAAVASRMFHVAAELGGSVSAEHGLGVLKRDFASLEHRPEAVELMRRVKSTLDPNGLLNPDKVLPIGPPDEHFLEREAKWLRLGGETIVAI